MILVKVWGLSDDYFLSLRREKIWDGINRVIASMPELTSHIERQTEEGDVEIIFPASVMPGTPRGERIFIEVVGLSECYNRPPSTRRKLTERLGQVVKNIFPDAKVAVMIQRFNHRADGYWEG